MITSVEAVDMVQEMVKQLVKDIKDRKLVPEHQDQVLKVVRCLYTEDFLREVSRTETTKEIVGINVERIWRDLKMDAEVTIAALVESWSGIQSEETVLRFLETEN